MVKRLSLDSHVKKQVHINVKLWILQHQKIDIRSRKLKCMNKCHKKLVGLKKKSKKYLPQLTLGQFELLDETQSRHIRE